MFLKTQEARNKTLKLFHIWQVMARESHIKYLQYFLDKYGNAVLASRTIFCVVMWVLAIRIEENGAW
uniref:Uncharacterized protein n=2 Tax=Sus scrofa TaxID=9823 RepID=A0A8D0YCZ4_PIG